MLAYRDQGGDVAVISPAGDVPRNLTGDASSDGVHQQPTWGPNGLLAWTAIDRRAGTSTVRIAGVEEGEPAEVEVPVAPFYFYWSPDGRNLAALGSGEATLELWLVDADEEPVEATAEGSPFYFSWSPDGQRMITHVGNETLSVLTLDGTAAVLSEESSGYQAPEWSTRDQLVHVAAGRQTLAALGPVAQADSTLDLVLMDASGAEVQLLHSFQGAASFSFSPDGKDLAYSVTPLQDRARTGVNFGPVVVVDLDTLESTPVSSDPVVLYQWSPNGDSLLMAAVVVEGSTRELRWRVWSRDGTEDFESFIPTAEFSTAYLPFWDQYAQSVRLWSPDGRAFVYTAVDASTDFVMVQMLSEDLPRRLTQGSVAFWSR